MTDETIVITAELRASTPKGIALFQGAKHEMTDHRTGEVTEREHWHWLPRSKVTIVNTKTAKPGGPQIVDVEMPTWLAKKVGLL